MGRPSGLMQGGKGQRERTSELPGGEGVDSVVSALKNRAGGIEEGIVERHGRRKVHIQRANKMFAVNVEIRDGNGGVVGDFALEGEAGLLHARRYVIAREGGDVIGDALGESRGQAARS